MLENINLIDAFVLLWLLTNVVLGCYYGLARQLVQIASLTGGAACAHFLHESVSLWLTREFQIAFPFQEVVVWVMTLALGYGLIRIVSYPFMKLLELEGSPLTKMNRVLGGLSSALVAFFIGYVALSAITWVNERNDDAISSWTDEYSSSVAIKFVEDYSAFDIIQSHEQELLRWIANISEGKEAQVTENDAPPKQPSNRLSSEGDDREEGILEDAKRFLGDSILGLVRSGAWESVSSDSRVLFYLESERGRRLAASLCQK